MSWTRFCSVADASGKRAGSVANMVLIIMSGMMLSADQKTKSECSMVFMANSMRPVGPGVCGRSGTKVAGTMGISPLQRSGWRMAKASAGSAPAEPPLIGSLSILR